MQYKLYYDAERGAPCTKIIYERHWHGGRRVPTRHGLALGSALISVAAVLAAPTAPPGTRILPAAPPPPAEPGWAEAAGQ